MALKDTSILTLYWQKNQTLLMDTWETHLNNNIMLVGASGRGKTRYFIKPKIMQMFTNRLIIYLKI